MMLRFLLNMTFALAASTALGQAVSIARPGPSGPFGGGGNPGTGDAKGSCPTGYCGSGGKGPLKTNSGANPPMNDGESGMRSFTAGGTKSGTQRDLEGEAAQPLGGFGGIGPGGPGKGFCTKDSCSLGPGGGDQLWDVLKCAKDICAIGALVASGGRLEQACKAVDLIEKVKDATEPFLRTAQAGGSNRRDVQDVIDGLKDAKEELDKAKKAADCIEKITACTRSDPDTFKEAIKACNDELAGAIDAADAIVDLPKSCGIIDATKGFIRACGLEVDDVGITLPPDPCGGNGGNKCCEFRGDSRGCGVCLATCIDNSCRCKE